MIGLFDSGMGGLSVLRAVRAQLPHVDVLYFGDNGQAPYGRRPEAEVRGFAEVITRFLLERGAQVIVVACNTASAAALHTLRQTFPAIPFVGMEPAVKPAIELTHTKVIGVLATPGTLRGELFTASVERFARDVTILPQTCPGLVRAIERGDTDTPETEALLRASLAPLLAQNMDVLVLGCTHYPFVLPLLQKVCGPQVRIIDPAPAVARQVGRVLEQFNVSDSAGLGRLTYYTSGDPEHFRRMVTHWNMWGAEIRAVMWEDHALRETPTSQ